MTKAKSERNSNHELLRLIAMYMIVFIHANMYLGNFCGGNFRIFSNGLVNGICNTGVSCFILISGYYGIKFNIKKLIKMECMMITFSLLETVILCLTFPAEMTGSVLLEQLVKSVMPFVSRKYWFYSSYVCLFLLSGFIQRFIEGLEQKQFQRLLLMLIVLFSVFPTLFYFEIIPDNGKGLVWMITVYLVGRYIKMYRDISLPTGKAFFLLVILWAVNGISHEFPIQIGDISHHLCKDNSISNLIIAVVLFYLFKNLQLHAPFINKVSSYIFAVFALNNALVTVCMGYIGAMQLQITNSMVGFLFLAGTVFLILAGCLCIGAVREMLLGRLEQKLGNLGQKIIEVKK